MNDIEERINKMIKKSEVILNAGKPKPMTNEEWLKSLDTEGLVDLLYDVHYGGASVVQKPWIAEHKERIKMQYRGWLKEKHKE